MLQGGGGLGGGRLQGVQYSDLHAKILQLQQQLAVSQGGQEQQDAARLGELLSSLRSSGRMAGVPLFVWAGTGGKAAALQPGKGMDVQRHERCAALRWQAACCLAGLVC